MKHLELFSGIGGFRRALDLLSVDGIMNFESVGYSEIDEAAKLTYKSNYDLSESEVDMGDIVTFVKDSSNVRALSDFELLTGGFPCQTFSMMGMQTGFNDESRGQMFFRILDIVDIKKPNYLLLENVKNLRTHDKGKTLKRIKDELECRGYQVFADIFNTHDFGLPQTRNRILIFATKRELPPSFKFTSSAVLESFKMIKKSSLDYYKSTLDILSLIVPEKYYLSERIKPTLLADGSANFKSKSEINLSIARPLTASMHKMHRACQDNYYSQDWIESRGKYNPEKTCTKEELATHKLRKLTPQEAFMLQGFPKEFAINASNNGVKDMSLYKQAGNAVSVNTIYAVLYYLIKSRAIT